MGCNCNNNEWTNLCEDPCTGLPECTCPVKDLSTDCVVYTGDKLECSGIEKNTILTKLIQQLDAFICNKFDLVSKFLNIKNIGTGAKVYKGINGIGEKELRTIKAKTSAYLDVTEESDTIELAPGTYSISIEGGEIVLTVETSAGVVEVNRILLPTQEQTPQVQSNILELNTQSPAFILNKNPQRVINLTSGGVYSVLNTDNNYTLVINTGTNNVSIDLSTITATDNIFVSFMQLGSGTVTFLNANVIPFGLSNIVIGNGHNVITEVISGTKYIYGGLKVEEIINVGPTAVATTVETLPLTSGTTTVTLDGSGSTDDGGIGNLTFSWTQTSGPAVSITSPTSVQTGATGLTDGQSYTFQLTVTDAGGLSSTDTVIVSVNQTPNTNPTVSSITFTTTNCCEPVVANTPPTANAGVDQSVEEGNTVTLTGSGTDTDGTIVSYLWTSTSGTITSPNSATTTVTGLTQGTHTFTLTVTDNDGATGTDTVIVTITAATPVTLTLSPVVNQGLDTYSGNLEITGIEGMDELIIIRGVPNISIGTTSFTVAGVQANPTASLNNTQYSISNTVFASATDIDDGGSGDTLTGNFTIIARLNGVDVASIGFNLFSDNNTNG